MGMGRDGEVWVWFWTRRLFGVRDEMDEFSSKCSLVSEINGRPCMCVSLLMFARPDPPNSDPLSPLP